MVQFNQQIVLAAETQVYIGMLILVLLLLVLAVVFCSLKIYDLIIALQKQSKMLEASARVQAREIEKKSW
jgi:hypothetical protein